MVRLSCFLCIYPLELKADSQGNISTPPSIAALFIIPKIWQQPNHSPTTEWLKKVCCVHTIKQYLGYKKKEILSSATTWTI